MHGKITMVLAAMVVALPCCAQAADPPPSNDAEKLDAAERRLADQYKHLEEVLLRMAELSASSDPRRAALLKKAVAQSKEELIAVRFDNLIELLGKDQLSKALENQSELDRDLRAMLELLLSENRAKRVDNQKARIREFLKQIGAIIQQEKDLQGRTAGGDDVKRLAGEQAKVAEKTEALTKDVRSAEEPNGDAKNGKEGGESTPSEQPPSAQEKKSDDAPAPDRLETARQRMNEAEAKLQEAQRQGAAQKQEEAIRELELAKTKLEEILRQLREEEIGRTLVMLEARFRKMFQMENEVYEGTVRLDKNPAEQRTHGYEIEASRLSGKQSQVVVEMDKALLLLRDDGSAVAFLEAAEQMRDDMRQVVERLAAVKPDGVTQGIEEDIIAALKEMIEALKKAQKDQEKNKNPAGQSPPSGMAQEPPLVDTLAELRMIRALQMRVNTRTQKFGKMIEGEQAENRELVEEIRRLAERQHRIHRITRDLQTGKNR